MPCQLLGCGLVAKLRASGPGFHPMSPKLVVRCGAGAPNNSPCCRHLFVDGGVAIGEAAEMTLAFECPESFVQALVGNQIFAHIIPLRGASLPDLLALISKVPYLLFASAQQTGYQGMILSIR